MPVYNFACLNHKCAYVREVRVNTPMSLGEKVAIKCEKCGHGESVKIESLYPIISLGHTTPHRRR